mmetsp:Transcript_163284/g.518902  ORF Transcript_163284/g.518902 Transcript_163284/m.518902 type:complete len:246 (+) Transcript_163284:137-874(+)
MTAGEKNWASSLRGSPKRPQSPRARAATTYTERCKTLSVSTSASDGDVCASMTSTVSSPRRRTSSGTACWSPRRSGSSSRLLESPASPEAAADKPASAPEPPSGGRVLFPSATSAYSEMAARRFVMAPPPRVVSSLGARVMWPSSSGPLASGTPGAPLVVVLPTSPRTLPTSPRTLLVQQGSLGSLRASAPTLPGVGVATSEGPRKVAGLASSQSCKVIGRTSREDVELDSDEEDKGQRKARCSC